MQMLPVNGQIAQYINVLAASGHAKIAVLVSK